MLTPELASIHIYPIKSTAGIAMSNAWVDELGLNFDRRFMLSDERGKFITARTEPSLCLIQANLTPDGLILTAPGMPILAIKYQDLSPQYQEVTVWGTTVNGQKGLKNYDLWFSKYLNKPCVLLYFGEQSNRYVKDKSSQVAYADSYPLLLISQASLTELNQRGPLTHNMAQFRPNIVVKNCSAFAEDGWQQIRIGEVEFEIINACSRCIFTTIEPTTGQKNKDQEPLKTLKNFRQDTNGEVYFGQNLIPLNTGQIKIGDSVKVIHKQTPKIYLGKTRKATKTTQASNNLTSSVTIPAKSPVISHQPSEVNAVSKKVNIMFDSWGTYYQGNTKDTLLEQGETAGLIMPYSCRGGNCGRCKVKLQSGEVKQLATDGLMPDEQAEGYILACSSIPQSDIVITKD